MLVLHPHTPRLRLLSYSSTHVSSILVQQKRTHARVFFTRGAQRVFIMLSFHAHASSSMEFSLFVPVFKHGPTKKTGTSVLFQRRAPCP